MHHAHALEHLERQPVRCGVEIRIVEGYDEPLAKFVHDDGRL